ncbi:MAG TPA: extracellular solute-binding protein [Gemmatimonadaceae bacterium]|nr:extracellular solute-binding protein [Gemmatimonadaceae bacterium]
MSLPPAAGLLALLVALSASCAGDRTGEAGPLVVFNAGSLARPLRAALDSFSARTGVPYEQEQAGSLESARKLTELGRIPDVLALADDEIFPKILTPEHVSWFARFARNRMVLAYTDRSRFADEITADNWFRVVTRPGVEVGRASPDIDPAGYRTVLVFQLAERFYGEPGLMARLLDAIPPRNIRPKAEDLLVLVETGELDYVWEYESVAQGSDLRFVRLPAAIDLSDIADSVSYGVARLHVAGASSGDTIEIIGAPISYGLSIPIAAPHPDLAARFVAFLLGPDGRRIMRAAHLDAVDEPEFVGTGVPASLLTPGR